MSGAYVAVVHLIDDEPVTLRVGWNDPSDNVPADIALLMRCVGHVDDMLHGYTPEAVFVAMRCDRITRIEVRSSDGRWQPIPGDLRIGAS